jgi:NAD+ synthase (glutamine-hydrolysing)
MDITARNGAAYLFSNMRGCDGGRLYFDGFSLIACNGRILKYSDAFSLKEVEVITYDLDLA